MNAIRQFFLSNSWKTTVGGYLLAVQPLVWAAGFKLTENGQHWMNLLTAVGGLMVGRFAKDNDQHSTKEEVQQSTDKEEVQQSTDKK